MPTESARVESIVNPAMTHSNVTDCGNSYAWRGQMRNECALRAVIAELATPGEVKSATTLVSQVIAKFTTFTRPAKIQVSVANSAATLRRNSAQLE